MNIDQFKSDDYYERLGLPHSADRDQIDNAYNELCKRFDSEAGSEFSEGDRNAEIFSLINEAYFALTDLNKKSEYDQRLAQLKGNYSSLLSADQGAGAGQTEEDPMRVDLDDLPTRPYLSVRDKRRMRHQQKITDSCTAIPTLSHGARSFFHGGTEGLSAQEDAESSGFYDWDGKRRSTDLILLFCGVGLPIITLIICVVLLYL